MRVYKSICDGQKVGDAEEKVALLRVPPVNIPVILQLGGAHVDVWRFCRIGCFILVNNPFVIRFEGLILFGIF